MLRGGTEDELAAEPEKERQACATADEEEEEDDDDVACCLRSEAEALRRAIADADGGDDGDYW